MKNSSYEATNVRNDIEDHPGPCRKSREPTRCSTLASLFSHLESESKVIFASFSLDHLHSTKMSSLLWISILIITANSLSNRATMCCHHSVSTAQKRNVLLNQQRRDSRLWDAVGNVAKKTKEHIQAARKAEMERVRPRLVAQNNRFVEANKIALFIQRRALIPIESDRSWIIDLEDADNGHDEWFHISGNYAQNDDQKIALPRALKSIEITFFDVGLGPRGLLESFYDDDDRLMTIVINKHPDDEIIWVSSDRAIRKISADIN